MKNLIRKNFAVIVLIFVLSVLPLIYLIPIIRGGYKGVFYIIDPDVVYVSNALSYIKLQIISYVGHPGTPTTIFLSFILDILRPYTKLIVHKPFIEWTFLNISFVYLYLRLLLGVILATVLSIFLVGVYKLNRSPLVIIYAWLAINIYGAFPAFWGGINSDATSFYFAVGWTFLLSLFLNKRKYGYLPLLTAISGLAVANKFSNAFLVPATLALAFSYQKTPLKERFVNMAILLVISIESFVFGTWPVRDKYREIFNWVFTLFSHSGFQGQGPANFLDLNSYIQNIKFWFFRVTWPTLLALIPIVYLFLKTKHLKNARSLFYVSLAMLAGFLAFQKYADLRYQITNYTILVFISAWVFNRIPKIAQIVLIILLIFHLNSITSSYMSSFSRTVNETVALENYVEGHPSQKPTLWDYAKSKEYAYLWSRDWTVNLYGEELMKYRPDLWELITRPTYEKVCMSKWNCTTDIFDVCWENLYIFDVHSQDFLDRYKNLALTYYKVPGTVMGVVKSDHCD